MAAPKVTRLRKPTIVRSVFARHSSAFRMGQERQVNRPARRLSGPLTEKLADAFQRVPEVPEEVDDGIHEDLIAEEASDGNPS